MAETEIEIKDMASLGVPKFRLGCFENESPDDILEPSEEQRKAFYEKRMKERDEELIAEHERIEKVLVVDKCKRLGISPAFYFSKLSDYKPKTKAQQAAKDAAEKMIATRKGKLIMLGSNGVGKSMLLNIIARELGGNVYTMYEIATMIRQSYTNKAAKSELEIVKDLVHAPFLGIDEIGRIAATEAVQNWFSHILSERHSLGLPVGIAGNLHLKKDCEQKGCGKCFETFFDRDVLSRFHEDTTVVFIKAPDERRSANTLAFVSD